MDKVNYGDYNDIVKKKEEEIPYVTSSIPDGGSVYFIFQSVEKIRGKNFHGKVEDQWHYEFKDASGKNDKEWDTGSLAVFNMFKEQNIQPGDRVLITKEVNGTQVRYKVKKEEGASTNASDPEPEAATED